MHKLTVIIPTFNEGKNIAKLLPLVTWADEIIVVDSFSTDKTVEIAKQFNVKILEREYINSANQKNWTIPQAKHEWIFLIDADELPSPQVILEIKELLKKDLLEYDAYWIPRSNYFLGQPVRYSGWQGDKVIRFFHRDRCQYEEKQVHAEILTKGKVGKLQGHLNHYTYKTLVSFSEKMERYAKWSAQDHLKKTPKVTYYHLWLKPAFRFFSHFVLKRGFLDGRVGFIISSYMAWGVFLRYSKLYELHCNQKKENKD